MTLHELYKKLPNKHLLILLEHGEIKINYFEPSKTDIKVESCWDDTVSISYKRGKHKFKETRFCPKDRKEHTVCELMYSYILEEEDE